MKMNNKGFGTIEIILIIIIVAILGFVGYRAYMLYTSEAETGAEQNKYEFKEEAQVMTEDESKDKNAGFLVIEEWGVRLPVIKSDTLKYARTKPDGQDLVDISGVNLIKLDKFCDVDEISSGLISRSLTPDNTDGSPPEFIKKIGDYYYYYSHPQSFCTDDLNSEARMLELKVTPEIEASIKKLEAAE